MLSLMPGNRVNSAPNAVAVGGAADAGERSGWPYRMLSRSWVYEALGSLTGAERGTQRLVVDHVRPFPGARILDVGCGTAKIAAHLGDVEYLGVEPNPSYVQSAQRTLGTMGRVALGGIDRLAEVAAPPYDRILFIGVLHHLPDALIAQHVAQLSDWLAPEGRLVAVEATLFEGQARLPRTFARLDRGRHVRAPDAYAALLDPAFSCVRTFLRSDLLAIPYVHCVVEAST